MDLNRHDKFKMEQKNNNLDNKSNSLNEKEKNK